MKARSHFNALGIEHCSSHRKLATLLSSAPLAMAATILVFTLPNGEAAPQVVDACRQTASDVLTSCRSGADSDYQLTLGKCDNLADAAKRQACQQQASADLQDARQTCQEQNDARLAACQRLGGAPYDPVIDPSNFVSRVDNPYFPLTPGTTFIYEGRPSTVLNTMSLL